MSIKIEGIVPPSVEQWQAVVRGMRNPMNSWDKLDSGVCFCPKWDRTYFDVGAADMALMKRLAKAGSDHRKYLRMLPVMMDVTAPLYWWKEYDTYKVGTVANSCSTMHKIHERIFVRTDFSHDQLDEAEIGILDNVIAALNYECDAYLQTKNKDHWYQMIQLLPSSYNQKRTVFLNYEVLWNIYQARKEHRLDEWREFCQTIVREVPYFAEIFEIGE